MEKQKFRLWSKIGFIFFILVGASQGWSWVYQSIKDVEYIHPLSYLLLIVYFLAGVCIYTIPSLPLAYYGWSKRQ